MSAVLNPKNQGSVADARNLASLILDLLVNVLAEDLEPCERDESNDAHKNDVLYQVGTLAVANQFVELDHHVRLSVILFECLRLTNTARLPLW